MAEKTRATMLQTKFGLVDEELKTPAHDAIMVWLDQNMMKNAQGCLNTKQRRILTESLRYADRYAREAIKDFPSENLSDKWIIPDIDEIDPFTVIGVKKEWESPVMSKAFMIGFIDMKVGVTYSGFSWTQKNGYSLPVFGEREHGADFMFEVKPKIPSCGELIRQINMYKEYIPDAYYFVVTPDVRFSEILLQQGIGTVKSPA